MLDDKNVIFFFNSLKWETITSFYSEVEDIFTFSYFILVKYNVLHSYTKSNLKSISTKKISDVLDKFLIWGLSSLASCLNDKKIEST